MAARAVWTGAIKIAELICPVKMYAAATTAERISLHMINRQTGNRLSRVYVDVKSGAPVSAEDQVKGYETSDGSSVVLEQAEIAAAVPDSDKTLSVDAFIACNRVEPTYFDKPYYLLPVSEETEDSFVLIREALRNQKVAALAHAVLFRRLRPVLIRAHQNGLIATTLNFDYEVRSEKAAFDGIQTRQIEPEMLKLAQHILKTKAGTFTPDAFDDRYEQALGDLVQAKIDGRKIIPLRPPEPTKKTELLEALRLSANENALEITPAKKTRRAKAGTPATKTSKRKAS